MKTKKDEFSSIIAAKLENNLEQLKNQWNHPDLIKTRYFFIDDLLPEEMAKNIFKAFPTSEKMRLMNSFREKKWTTKTLDALPPILHDITFAIQDDRVLKLIELITGIGYQRPDPYLYAGGLSMMGQGHFLNPHIDNSHDHQRKFYRTVNLLYYVTPDWEKQNGGNLELWDAKVKERVEIVSRFNRLVVMETNCHSWHSVNKVQVAKNRCCVSNYYFSPKSPMNQEYFHITAFKARPEQFFKNTLATADNHLRSLTRKIFRKGIGKKDLYINNDKNL